MEDAKDSSYVVRTLWRFGFIFRREPGLDSCVLRFAISKTRVNKIVPIKNGYSWMVWTLSEHLLISSPVFPCNVASTKAALTLIILALITDVIFTLFSSLHCTSIGTICVDYNDPPHNSDAFVEVLLDACDDLDLPIQ